MALNKYNNLLTSGRWFAKDPKYSQILVLVGVAQKLMDDSNKKSDKSNRGSNNVEPAYIRYLPYHIM